MPRVVVTGALSGPANMQLDLELLALAEEGEGPFLRVYAWDGPWLSLGYFQRVERAVDAGLAEKLGVGVVRRPTGGKALLHAGDVTYSVAVPAGHAVAGMGIVGAYEAISGRVVEALRALGVAAEMGRRKPGTQEEERGARGVGPCAAEVLVESVVVGGRKLVGSAQVRRKGALLQHGSIPVAEVREEWVRTLFPGGREGWWEWYRERTTTLEREVGAVDAGAVGAALVEAFQDF
jgi:lipoate-protein ligase A